MKQLSVELQDRELRFDGVSIISPEGVVNALLRGVPVSKLRLLRHNRDTELFNDNSNVQLFLNEKEPVKLDFGWLLPEPYLSMDLEATIIDRTIEKLKELDYSEKTTLYACERVQEEVEEIKRRGMVEFFKTIIYVLDVFRKEGVIWGVGRGSSCASYVLFILGLHAVDCVAYNVPMSEFFHD